MSILIVLPILTLLMYDLGLTLEPQEFKVIATRPKSVIAGLAGQLILLPAVAFFICKVCSLPPVLAIGLMLVACCPGGSSSNIFSKLASGNVALSVSLTAISSIITLFTMPVIMAWVANSEITLPIGNLLVQNILLMLVPIIGGILTRKYAPFAARLLDRALSRLAFPALMLLAAIFFISEYQAILDNFASLGLSVCLLTISAMLCGFAIARSMRLDSRDTRTIIIEVGMQNAAQAIAVACSPFVFNNPAIAAPAIIYALIMNIFLIAFVAYIRHTSPASHSK